MPQLKLSPGDLDNDNVLTTTDLNILQACFDNQTSALCGDKKQAADLTDDGKVDVLDYNVYRDTVKSQEGD